MAHKAQNPRIFGERFLIESTLSGVDMLLQNKRCSLNPEAPLKSKFGYV